MVPLPEVEYTVGLDEIVATIAPLPFNKAVDSYEIILSNDNGFIETETVDYSFLPTQIGFENLIPGTEYKAVVKSNLKNKTSSSPEELLVTSNNSLYKLPKFDNIFLHRIAI